MTRLVRLIVLALGLMVAVTPAHAGPGERRAAREQLREKLRAVRIARLVEALNLDGDTAARLMPVLDRGYDAISAISRQSGAARRELRILLASERPERNDDARILQLVDQLAENRARIEQLTAEMLRGVRQVLTPRQVGKLVLVLPEIEKQLQLQIRRAARQAGALPGGDPDDDP